MIVQRARSLMRFFALPTLCGLWFSGKFSDGGEYEQHEIPERARTALPGDPARDDEIPCRRPGILRDLARERQLLCR